MVPATLGSVPDPSDVPRSPAPDGRSTRWDEHRTARRRELVDATLRAIRQHGAGVGMDEVAVAAATSKTVIYRHFEDKAGLYLAVAERVDQRIMRHLAEAVTGAGRGGALPAGSAPRDQARRARAVITSAVDAYLALVEADPEVYRFIVTRPLVDRPIGHDPVGGITSHAAEQVSALLRSTLTDVAVDPRVARVWAIALVGMVQAAADDWVADAHRAPRAELVSDLATLAWHGLEPAFTRSNAASRRKAERAQ